MAQTDDACLQNGSLENLLRDQKRSAEFREPMRVLRLAAEVLAGLVHLHLNNVPHGNLVPRNVLLDENHRAKLVAFGLAGRPAGVTGRRASTDPDLVCWLVCAN